MSGGKKSGKVKVLPDPLKLKAGELDAKEARAWMNLLANQCLDQKWIQHVVGIALKKAGCSLPVSAVSRRRIFTIVNAVAFMLFVELGEEARAWMSHMIRVRRLKVKESQTRISVGCIARATRALERKGKMLRGRVPFVQL